MNQQKSAADRCARAEVIAVNSPQVEVLILAHYSEIGVLMGALVELSGHIPRFPNADESATDAVRRVCPAVVLLEWEHELAGSRALRDAIDQVQANMLLFSPAQSGEEFEKLAGRLGLAAITFPLDPSRFGDSLRAAVEASGRATST